MPGPYFFQLQAKLGLTDNIGLISSARDVSDIGTKLAAILKAEIGAFPCGNCKADILSLNRMTREEVQADREQIVARIYARLGEVSLPVVDRLKVLADAALGTGQAERWIGIYLDRACE